MNVLWLWAFFLCIYGFQSAWWIPTVSEAESRGLPCVEEWNLWGSGSSTPSSPRAVHASPMERLSDFSTYKGELSSPPFPRALPHPVQSTSYSPHPGTGLHRLHRNSLQGLPGFCDRSLSPQEHWGWGKDVEGVKGEGLWGGAELGSAWRERRTVLRLQWYYSHQEEMSKVWKSRSGFWTITLDRRGRGEGWYLMEWPWEVWAIVT